MRLAQCAINGAKVAIYKTSGLKAVNIRVLIKAGSWYEKGHNWGAFHLLEHLTETATRSFKTDHSIESYKEENGITSNAWTSGHSSQYLFHFPEHSLKEGLVLFGETLFYPRITFGNIENEKRVIAQEYKDKWSNPDTKFWNEFCKKIYGKFHPYSRDGMGQPEYINGLSKADLVELHSRYYLPNNMSISVAGGVDSGLIIEELSRIFKRVKNGEQAEAELPPVLSRNVYFWHKERRENVHVSIVWLVPGRDELSLKERIKFNMASYIIGGSARSLIYKRLRSGKGLIYSGGSSILFHPTVGEFLCWANTSHQDCSEVIKTLDDIIYNFGSQNISEVDFERGKKFMQMKTMLGYDSLSDITLAQAGQLFWEGKVRLPEEYIRLSEGISLNDIKETVNLIATLKRRNVGVMSEKEPGI